MLWGFSIGGTELHREHVVCAAGCHASRPLWILTGACIKGGNHVIEQIFGSQVFTKARNSQLRERKIKVPYRIMLCIWGLKLQHLM